MGAISKILLNNYKVIIAVIVVFFLLNKKSKAVTVTTILDVDRNGIPDGWSPNVFTEQLYNAMEDWVALKAGEKETLWREMATFSDGQLKLIYNYFNNKFSDQLDQTLTQKINSETGAWIYSIKPDLVKRLRSLNLN